MKFVQTYLLVLLTFVKLAAQPIPDVQVSRTNLLIGETAEMIIQADSLSLQGPPSWLLPDSLARLVLLAVDTSSPYRCIIKVTGWDSGYQKPDPVFMIGRANGRSVRQAVALPPIRINLAKLSNNHPDDIKPLILPKRTDGLMRPIIIALVAVLLCILLVYLFKKKKRFVFAEPSKDELPITTEEIRITLQKLSPEEWAKFNGQKEQFLLIREQLNRLFKIKDMKEDGNGMIGRYLTQQEEWIGDELRRSLSESFRISELVIYAKYKADAAACKQFTEDLLLLLEKWDQREAASSQL